MARATVMLLLVILVSAAADAAESEVVISAQSVDPPVLRVLPDQRVLFVNRSGRSMHIDLVGDAKQHHVFRVSGAIWAIFHRPGRHAYIVHLEDPGGGRMPRSVNTASGSLVSFDRGVFRKRGEHPYTVWVIESMRRLEGVVIVRPVAGPLGGPSAVVPGIWL